MRGVAFVLPAVLCTLAPAQAGALDTTFAPPDGFRAIPGIAFRLLAVAVQADGRIVAAGRGTTSGAAWAVLRLKADGSFDGGFGSGGLLEIASSGSGAEATDVAVDDSGRILVTGQDAAGFRVVRLLADGSPDTSFGSGGEVVTEIQNSSTSSALELEPLGSGGYRIVVAGLSSGRGRNSDAAFTVARYLEDGSLDTQDFGDPAGRGGGKKGGGGSSSRTGFVVDDVTSGHDRVWEGALALLADGSIVVGGVTGSLGTIDSPWVIARYLPDGTPDTAFGDDGHVLDELSGFGSRQLRGVAVQADGKVLAVGRGYPSGGPIGALVIRYDGWGARDAGFGIGGIASTAVSFENQPAFGMVLEADGRIAIATTAYDGSQTDNMVWRFTGDGSLDATFGSGGPGASTATGTINEQPLGIARDAAGSYVVVGGSGGEGFAGRWLGQ